MRNMAMAWARKWRRPFVTLAVLLVMSLRVEAEDLEVTRLQRIDPASINIFCTTTNGVTPNDDEDQYELSFANLQSEDINLVSTSKASSNPQVFELDVQTLYGGKTAFTLALKKKDQSVKASTAMTFEMQDVSGVKASCVGVRQAAGPGVVLRLYGHPVSVLACPEEGEDNSDCLDFSPDDNYRESSGLSGLSTALCMRMEEDPTLPFCLVSVAIMTVIETPYEDEIRLSHQEDQAAAPEGTLFIAESIATGSTRDLLYWSNEKLGACPGTSTCKIGDFPSSNNQYEVFFVDYQEADGEIIETSSVMQFEDFSPVGTVIEPNMLEIRWTKTTEQYNLLLTDPNGDEITTQPPPFTSIVVNCGGLNECFGYFINLPQGDYKVMIRPWTGINLIMTNSVLSSKQTILNSESKPSADLEIQKVHLDWNTDVSKAFASVCFTHKAETSKNLSHFELVMVDQKGQWVRSRAATQKTDEGACFTGVTLLSDEFFLSGKVTVIVIERDFDGLSVVASAHTETFFKTNYDLTITKFEIVDKGDKKFSVHFSGASELVSAGVLSVINAHSDSVTELNMELTDVSDTEGDFVASDLLMSWINRHKVLKWVLRLHAGDDILMLGGADFTFPDLNTFPTCSPAHLIGQKQMVRLKCNDQSLETDTIVMTGDDLAIQACTGVKGVNYHLLDKPATLPASIQLCRKVEDNLEVDICTGHIEVIDATADAAALTAIKVEYESKISVQQTPPDKNNFDSLVYYYKRDPDPLTIKYCTEDNCEMQGYIGVEDLEVLVVYVDGTQGEPVKSEQRTVYGLELRGTQISNSVSELAIKKRPDRDVYQVIIENISPPGMEVRVPTFTTAKVMCQDVEITCYAYFSLTAGEKYKAIVSPYDDKAGEGAPDDMNQIVSLEMTVLQYSRKRVTKDTKELTLKQINRVKADTTRFSTDVTVVNDLEDIKNIASVTLAIMHDNGEQYEAISNDVGDGTIQQNTEKVFHFDINPTDNVLGPKTTVLFIAKDASNGPLATAEVTVDFQTLDPTMSWVGGPDTAPLRVSTDKDVEINGVPFSTGTSYSLDFINALPSVEVCVTLENTAPAGGTVRLCDLTRSIESFKDMVVDEVELNTNDGKRGMTVTSTFKGMEAVLYNPEDSGIVDVTFTCATENTCFFDISDQMSKLSPVFKVLVVGVDAPDVVSGAKVVDFEDFQTFVQRFSDASDLEVRWQASSNQDFNVHLENDVPGGFTDVAVHCGGDEQRACKAYFTNLAPDVAYTAKVIKDNIAVSYTTPATAGATTPLSITQLSEVSTSPLQTKLTFSADAEVTGVKYVEYVVIDPLTDGKAAQRIVFKDTNDNIAAGDNNIIFDVAELPNSGAVSTVLVVVHGADPDALAAGKVVAAFEDIKPTMSWVGGEDTAPLRVSTDMDVEINGVPFSAGTSYSLDFINALPLVEVCVTLENTAPAGGTVRLCDLTRSIESFKELSVDKIELNYDAGKHVMTVSSTFAGMEAVLYQDGASGVFPGTFSCDTENTCSSLDINDQISNLSPTFKVLVVGVGAGTVTGAKVVDFVDFQVRVQRFSAAGDLEVRWRASSEETYKIHLDTEVPDGFTDVSVVCGGTGAAENRGCKAYFTKLEADTPYKAELRRDNTVVSATVSAAPGAYTPVTITHFTKVSTSPLQTKLTFLAEAGVTGVEYVEYVVIDPPTNGEAAQRIVFTDTNENIVAGDNSITFDVTELPNPGAVLTVLVVVHGADGVDSDALAAGKVTVVFEDPNPTMTWVGGLDTAPLRVNTNLDLEINGVPFSTGTSYSLDFNNAAPPVEVCVKLDNTAPAGGTVRQCDVTWSIGNVEAMTVNGIELNYDAGKHVMTVSSTFAGMEAVLYQDGASGVFPRTFFCNTENTCSSPDINDQILILSPTFKVLVVGVDAGAVTGAKVVDIEDFQVRVQRFSAAGDLEVRWRASSEETYKIHLDTEVPDGFTDVSVVCGGAGAAENRACKAYFTKLEADTPYKAELRRDNTVVSATVPAVPGSGIPVTITEIAQISPQQTQLTVTAEREVIGIEHLEYVVIDPPSDNEATQQITIKDVHCVINVDTDVVFDVQQLPNTGVEVTIFIVVHGRDGVDIDALAAGKVVVTLRDIQSTMNWVGGTDTPPLRIHANQGLLINGIQFAEGTSYLLEFDALGSNPEVCVTLENTAPAGGTVNQCDSTQTPENVAVLDVQKVELSHEADGKSTMIVSSTFTNMEAVLYNAGDSGKVSESFSCVTENTCSSDVTTILSELKTTFKFLAVGVDGADTVTGATLIDFEDFQTSALRFSDAGDLEVRWRASSDQLFNVHVNNNNPLGFTDVSVQCGGAEEADQRACKAYYTMLKAGTTYKAEVKRDNVAVSTTVPPTSASVTPLTITRISQVSKSPSQTQLTVSAAAEVAGIGYLDYVMIDPPVDNIAPQHIAFSDALDSIDTSSSIITFDDADQPQTLVEVTVLVVAYGADGRDGDILASGKVLVYFADLEPPKMTKVGTEEMKSLKAETGDFDVRVNGETCRAKSVCYFLEVDDYLEPPEVCRDTGSSVEQCDMTGSYLLPKNLVNPAVDLMYKGIPEEELTVTAEFDANSVTMEAMIYDDAGTETSSPITCTIKSSSCVFTMTPSSIMFKILLMALDSKGDVFETNTIEFEDFQTRMEQLASEALQVSWRASQALNYTVKIHPDPVGFPGVMQVECGGEQPEDSSQCLAFFVGLTAGGEYTGNVNKRDDGTRSVSAFLQLETERVYTPIIITSLIAREEGDKTRSLSVCFKDDLLANRKGSDVMTQTRDLKYSLVVVDALGRHFLSPADLLSLSPSSNVEDDLCFSAISLGFDFDLRKKLRVFVKREATGGERNRAVGDIEVHLLDPQGLVDVRQVGPRTVRVRWKDVNRALGYEVRIGDQSLPAACGEDSEKECVRYLHVDRGESRLFVTLKAVGARVRQEVEVPLALRDLSTLRIYSTALTEDNRLRVCFDPIPRAYQYLLGLEDEKSLVLESRRVFPQQEDDLTCVLSAEEVDLGGQLSRRTLVTAFDASDKPVASGTATVQEFFLSPKRKVFAVANETNHDLIATWFLLDDPGKVTAYYVTLEQATGGRKDDDPVVLSRTSMSHVFEGVTSGRYSVCVVASAEGAGSVFRSREVCSDIVSVPSAKVEIPEVAETEVKSAGLDKALVTWQKTEDEDDVTNYVITWTKAAPSTSNRARPRQPLPLVAQGFRDVEQERHHRIVPASSPSLEVLSLDPREVYEVCVSAVRKGVAGNHKCKRIELGKDDPLDSPSGLVFENDLLGWKEVASASGYLVEWRPRLGGISEGGQEEVKTTSWPAGNLSPGWWVVSVRAVTETRASQPVAAEYLKKGIEIVSAVQPNNNQLLLRWQEEPIPPCAESMCNYTITISHDKAPFWHSCSGLKGDCEKVIQVEGGTQVEVALERNGVKNSMKEVIYDFSEVSGLSERSSSADKEVTVSWTPSEEAVLYNVTLFTDRARSSIRLTEMISRETLTLREDNMAGNVLLVQPCADKHHCGSGQNITVMSVADTPSNNVPVLATSVAVGVLLLVGLVLAASVVIMKKTKRKQMNDTCRLEEVARAPSVSSQQSIGLHSSDHQIISLSALSLEGNKQQ